MRRLRKFLRLPATKRRLLVRAALLLGVIKLGLWLLPFHTLRHLLANVMEPPAELKQDTARFPVEDVIWAVEVASRHMPAVGTCLTRALAVQVLLTRRGYPALLHIGVVRGEEGHLQAHAWIESQERVVIGGSGLECYTPLVALEGKAPKDYRKHVSF